MTYIKSTNGLSIASGPIILVATTAELANVVINNFIKDGHIAIVNSTDQFYYDPTSFAAPSSTVIKPTDGADPGRWLLASFGGGGGGSGVIIFDGGVTSQNMRSIKLFQSPINNTMNGIVNLGSKTGGSSVGATGAYTTISGGDQNSATGNYSTSIGGLSNISSGLYSITGGFGNMASGLSSVAFGTGSIASHTGEQAQSSGNFAAQGDAQTTNLTMFGVVSNTLTEIFVDGSSETIILPNNSIYGFDVTIACFASTAKIAGYWHFKGAAKMNNIGVISLVGGAVDKLSIKDDLTWDAVVDVLTNRIRVRVQARVGDTNRCIARVQLTETRF